MSGPKKIFQQMAFVIEFPGRVSSQQEIPQMKPMQYYPLQSSNIAPEKVACKILLGIWWLHSAFFVQTNHHPCSWNERFRPSWTPFRLGQRKNTFNVQSDLHQCWDPLFQLVPWIGVKRDLFRYFILALSHGWYQACTIFGEAMSVLRECRRAG